MEKYFDVKRGQAAIKCKLYARSPRQIRSVILSCHGFGGNKDNSASRKIAEVLLPVFEDLAVISFDWPCHGDDVKKKLTLADCNDYLVGVLDYIRTDLKAERVYLQATSFGGYLTLKYMSEHGNPFRKAAFRCPAVHMHTVMTERILTADELENILRGKPEEVGFDRKVRITREFLQELQENDLLQRDFSGFAGDILIMQGTADELVDHGVVKQFAENAGLDFVTIEGADHRFKDPAKMRACIDLMELFFV